jgi:exosortase A
MSSIAWRQIVSGVILLVALLALFRETALAMTAIWSRSDTFAHAFLVPPIVVWLVWRRREVLATLDYRPAPALLLLIAAACLFWLLGELANVSVPTLFGLAVGRALLFPLLFLYFCVPVGEFLVPQLMEWTADFTVLAVRASGIPIYREGLQFVIPSGNWSVVEACSGVRYLIASFMVGTLFAYLNFRTMRRRAIFMVVSILVPIVANWLRAYLIVMIGHLSGNQLAVGVDHLIYGWVFFGIVIMLMFTIGARWAENDEVRPVAEGPLERRRIGMPSLRLGVWPVGLGVLWRLDHAREDRAPLVQLPSAPAGGWRIDTESLTDWKPGFQNPSAVAASTYSGDGKRVGVWMGYYRRQGPDRKLVSSSNELADGTLGRWSQVSARPLVVPLASGSLTVRAAELRASHVLDVAQAERLRVWQLYWVGGGFTASDVRAKIRIALDRLLGRGDDGAVILLFTPIDGGNADATLEAFARSHLDTFAATLAAVRDAQ